MSDAWRRVLLIAASAAVFGACSSTPAGWTFAPPPTSTLSATAAVTPAASGPSASPSASSSASQVPSAPPTGDASLQTVTSERFGWSVGAPPTWRYRPATEDWPPRTYPAAGAPYTDNFETPDVGFPLFDVSTQELPADQTQDEFIADLDAGNAGLGCDVDETGELAVDGETGRLQRQTCAGGLENAWEVTVFHGNRVYLIYWIGLASAREQEEPLFRQVMNTFRFAPD